MPQRDLLSSLPVWQHIEGHKKWNVLLRSGLLWKAFHRKDVFCSRQVRAVQKGSGKIREMISFS